MDAPELSLADTRARLVVTDDLERVRRLGATLAGSRLPSFVSDLEGRVASLSPAAVEFFGLPSRLPAGRRCWEIVKGCFEDGEPLCSQVCPILASLSRGLEVPVHRVNVRSGRTPSRRSTVHMHHLMVLDEGGGPPALVHLVDDRVPPDRGEPVPGRFLG